MRGYALAIAAAAIVLIPSAAFSQAVEIGPRGIEIAPAYPYYHGRSSWRPNCGELRRACLYKEELGEQGQGNCQRYRRLCRQY